MKGMPYSTLLVEWESIISSAYCTNGIYKYGLLKKVDCTKFRLDSVHFHKIGYPRWNAARRGQISSFNAVKMAKVILFAGGESHLECGLAREGR